MSASDAAIDDLPKEEPQTPPLSQSNGENGSQDAAPKKRGPKGMTEAEKEEARRKRKEAAQEEEEDSGVSFRLAFKRHSWLGLDLMGCRHAGRSG